MNARSNTGLWWFLAATFVAAIIVTAIVVTAGRHHSFYQQPAQPTQTTQPTQPTRDVASYLHNLSLANIYSDNGDRGLIGSGDDVCDAIASRVPARQVANRVRHVSDMTPLGANILVDEAQMWLCPQVIARDGSTMLPME